MDISKYLNAAIGLKKITQKSLADRLGKSPAYVNKLCKGTKNPSMELLDQICQALEMTPSEFFSCPSDAPSMQLQKAEIRLIHNFRGLYDYERDVISDMVSALRRKHLPAVHESAGPQSPARVDDAYAAASFSPDPARIRIPEKYADPDRFRVVVARGDSMSPEICNGDVVIVRRGSVPPLGGTAFVLLDSVGADREYAIRNFFIYGDRVELRSINPNFPTMVYPASSILSAEEVVEILHR